MHIIVIFTIVYLFHILIQGMYQFIFFFQYSSAGDDSVTEVITDLARGTYVLIMSAII